MFISFTKACFICILLWSKKIKIVEYEKFDLIKGIIKFVVYKYITKINFKPKTQNLTRIYFKLTILSIFSIFLKYLSILVQIKELSLCYVSF